MKVFDLTNHFNPRDFQNNIDSQAFGGFYSGVGRKVRHEDHPREEVTQCQIQPALWTKVH